jgi:ornithine cyclodeaminase/alanine dehydrogenase-like protein (mu-crystallin family)
VAGRRSPEEVTLFKSLGRAVEDVASARHIYEKARRGAGARFLELGGSRHEAD